MNNSNNSLTNRILQLHDVAVKDNDNQIAISLNNLSGSKNQNFDLGKSNPSIRTNSITFDNFGNWSAFTNSPGWNNFTS